MIHNMEENEMMTLINQLMDLYEPVARACCRSYRLPEDQIEDIVHDTFLAAYRTLPDYREEARFSSLVWTIAQRLIISRLRKQATRRRRGGGDRDHQSLVPPPDPSQCAQSQELHHRLRTSLAALPGPWMTAVELFYWRHMSTREIALQMRIKPGTVQVILHRSRQRLRQELGDVHAA